MPSYDRFLKPARPGPNALWWFIVGLILLTSFHDDDRRKTWSPGLLVLVRAGQFDPVTFSSGPSLPPFDEIWSVKPVFIYHYTTGRSEYRVSLTVTREDAQRRPLPPPTADRAWAALNAWIIADPERAAAYRPEFLRMCAEHKTFERHTDWRFFTSRASHLTGCALLVAATLITALALAREVRISREDSRGRRGHCPSCGYDRTTLPRLTPCPECGSTTPPQLPGFSWLGRRDCAACGYDLSSLAQTSPCPECGARPAPAGERPTPAKRG